jgi:Mrp family chromosome partitioning ATPase
MQDRLHSPTECKDLTGVRGLGLVPQVTRWSRVPLADRVVDEREMPRDAVRAVLELLFAARARAGGVRPCSIAITSTVPHEGKTVLAIWLARVSAMTGLRVLLVDADLRNPSVERYLGSTTAAGARRNSEPENGLQSMVTEDTVTGMHYVTCRASERVCGAASLSTVEGILQQARESYDLVVVDSAPVLAAPESLSICQMTDGVVVAVRWGHTRYRQVRYAANMLRSVNANVLGAVVTRADVRKHSLYGFGDVGDVYHQYPRYYRT